MFSLPSLALFLPKSNYYCFLYILGKKVRLISAYMYVHPLIYIKEVML